MSLLLKELELRLGFELEGLLELGSVKQLVKVLGLGMVLFAIIINDIG